MSDYGFETTLLHEGSRVTKLATDPETVPVYLTTAFLPTSWLCTWAAQ